MNKPLPNSFRTGPDDHGRFGLFGGRFVAETLMPLILELEQAYNAAKADPAYQGGNYTSQPLQGLRAAASISALQGFAPAYLARQYPTPAAADAYIDERVAKDIASRDANDMIWQLEASRTCAPDSRAIPPATSASRTTAPAPAEIHRSRRPPGPINGAKAQTAATVSRLRP